MQASLEGHSSKQKVACASQWQGMHPSDVLQKIVDDALALTGCAVHTASADGTRYSCLTHDSWVFYHSEQMQASGLMNIYKIFQWSTE